MPEEVDLIVIGSGQGGIPIADHFAQAGKHVVLFERGRLGGSCVNYGCTPSKAFLASAHNAGRARLAAPLGIHAEVAVDQREVMARTNRVRGEWNAGAEQRVAGAGVDLVRASAAFTGERTVAGGGREVRAPRVVIDTGTSPALPPIAGLANTPYFTNLTWFDQETLPARVLVVGGGYIGLELGQGAQRLGCAVTIVHAAERPMNREEADAVAAVTRGLTDDGVHFELGTQPVSASYAHGIVRLTLANGKTLEGEGLLLAAGRTPNTADLDLARSGIELGPRGYVKVDEYLQTACPGVYALGDVAGQPAFTHVSWEDHRRLLSTWSGTPRKRDDRVLSYTTFTEPQLARTGLTLEEARARGIDARARTLALSAIARGEEWNLTNGFFRLVVDANDKMIGATLVGYETGELVHTLGFAIELGARWQDLDRFVGIHPTFGEGLPSLARLFE
jgi:dihydrolipoamide dehydrogenase